MARKETREELLQNLSQFTGTQEWHVHMLGIIYTDGVQYLAETAGAYWLTDIVASTQCIREVRSEEFQVWTLSVDLPNSSGVVTCDDGDGNIVYQQDIGYTDFPLEKVVLYLENNVLLLPSER